jgi:hypothetical protein
MIEQRLPLEILRRLSTEKHNNDTEWIAAVRSAAKDEEIFKERNQLDGSSRINYFGKRERPAPPKILEPRPKKAKFVKATAKAKGNFKPRGPKAIKSEKGGNPPKLHTDWKQAHEGIPQDVIDVRRKNKGCTRCGLDNHEWKMCRRQITVATIGRQPALTPSGSSPPWKKFKRDAPGKRSVNLVEKRDPPERVWTLEE